MDPVGLTLSIAGLAGLFSSCIDAADRFQTFRAYGKDSHQLDVQFKAHKLHFEQWGLKAGLDQNGTLNRGRHPVLDDPETASTVHELFSIIRDLCEANSRYQKMGGRSSRRPALPPSGEEQTHSLQQTPGLASVSRRIVWAIRGRADRQEQVALIGRLVQQCQDLVPVSEQDASTDIYSAHYNLNGEALVSTDGVWIAELREDLARMRKEMDANDRRQLHSWLLAGFGPNNIFEENQRLRATGTCQWIEEREPFRQWLSIKDGSSHRLWIHGSPGCGKSVLCSHIAELVSSQSPAYGPTAQFFFTSSYQADSLVLIRSWISQIVKQDEHAYDAVFQVFLESTDETASAETLSTLFQDVLCIVPDCILIADGLDESAWDSVTRSYPIVKSFNLIKKTLSNTNTKVLFISRDEPHIRRALTDEDFFVEYQITSTDVQEDTKVFSEILIDQKLLNKPEEIKLQISRELTERCEGQFLWVKLQADSLKRSMNKKQLQKAIQESPPGLNSLYDRTWQRIYAFRPSDKSRAFRLLRWAAFSARPLTVGEMTEAVLVEEDSDEFSVEDLPDDIDKDFVNDWIMDLCAPLLQIRRKAGSEEGPVAEWTLHLAHHSVKEYILNRFFELTSPAATPSHRALVEEAQNGILARMCISYLDSEAIWTQGPSDHGFHRNFKNYAAANFFFHTSSSDQSGAVFDKCMRFFKSSNKAWIGWREWYHDESKGSPVPGYSMRRRPLAYMLHLQMHKIALEAIRGYHLSSEQDTPTIFELYSACTQSLLEVVEALYMCYQGCRPFTNEEWKTWFEEYGCSPIPLLAASRHGGVELAKVLIDHGADIMARDAGCGYTPLHTAAEYGQPQIAELLIAAGAGINTTDDDGFTPLYSATFGGHIDIVKLLLDHGADMEIPGKSGRTPLFTAVLNGHLELVKVFIEKGADAVVEDPDGFTPIFAASQSGNSDVAKLLMEAGAEFKEIVRPGWSPLMKAAQAGHIELAKLLIENGADVNAATTRGWTPLMGAAMDGHPEMVKLLLQFGADPTARSEDFVTPLYQAAELGNIQVLRLLIDHGANVSDAHKSGWSVSHSAAQYGHVEALKLLLDHGADILTTTTPHGWNVLHAAVRTGQIDVAKLLLSRTNSAALLNARTSDGSSLFLTASCFAELTMFDLILQYDDAQAISQPDNNGRTPLFVAARYGNLNVVERLMELTPMSLHVRDLYGLSPVDTAIINGHSRVVNFFAKRARGLSGEIAAVGASMDAINSALWKTSCSGRSWSWWAHNSGDAETLELVRTILAKESNGTSQADTPETIHPQAVEKGTQECTADGEWCDICTRTLLPGQPCYSCGSCDAGGLAVCRDCFDRGLQCRDVAHTLALRIEDV